MIQMAFTYDVVTFLFVLLSPRPCTYQAGPGLLLSQRQFAKENPNDVSSMSLAAFEAELKPLFQS